MMLCPNILQWRRRPCVDLRWCNVYVIGIVLRGMFPGCTFMLIRAWTWMCYLLAIDVVWGRNFTLTFVVCCRSQCVTMPMAAPCWSSFVKCMELVMCWPLANRKYVYIAVCVFKFEDVVLTHHHRVPFSCPNTLLNVVLAPGWTHSLYVPLFVACVPEFDTS